MCKMWAKFGFILSLVTLVSCQVDGEYPFVTIPDQAIRPPNTTTKVYTTTVFLRTTATFTNQIFIQAAEAFYSSTSEGFIRVDNLVPNDQNSTQVLLTYDVTYNYVTLRNDVNNSDRAIRQLIGRIQAVKLGIEGNDSTNSFTVDLSTFRFTGDSICDKAECHQGRFTFCEEQTEGIDVMCMSSCKVNFCRNNGWCHHSDGSVQPVCSCPTGTISWYIGRHCETYIHIWIPIVVLVCVIICLVIIIIVGVCLYRDVRIRRFKPKPKKYEYPNQKKIAQQPKISITNGNYPRQDDPLKQANASALERFKADHEKKSNGSYTRDKTLPQARTDQHPAPPRTSPPSESVITSRNSTRTSSPSSRGVTPAKIPTHYEDISSSTSTDSDVTEGSDSQQYASTDLPGGFDWRAPVTPAESSSGMPKYSIPNKQARSQEPDQDYISESKLI